MLASTPASILNHRINLGGILFRFNSRSSRSSCENFQRGLRGDHPFARPWKVDHRSLQTGNVGKEHRLRRAAAACGGVNFVSQRGKHTAAQAGIVFFLKRFQAMVARGGTLSTTPSPKAQIKVIILGSASE